MTSLAAAFRLSKEEVKNARPPGTTTLIEHLEWAASQTNHDEIRLVPQPSADPADPLNLPMWHKYAILAVMSIHPFVINFTSSTLSSALPIYASTPVLGLPPRPFSELTYLIAVNTLMVGCGNLLWVPLSNTFGRRAVNLASMLLLTASCVWAAKATSFDSLLWARFVMGVGSAPADAVSPDVVGEIFFVHQRGRAMAIYTVFLALGSTVGGVAGGYIVDSLGVPWLGWVNVILSGITTLLIFLFQCETLYDRKETTIVLNNGSEKADIETNEQVVIADSQAQTSYPPFTYVRSLKLIIYRGGLLRNFLGPFKVLRLPGVWLISCWYAGLVGLIVTISTISSQLMSAPPYFWGKNVGLINLGGIIGSFIGLVYTYFLADWTTKREATKDIHGYAEPESRLVTALPALGVATAGSLVFGLVAQNPSEAGWVGLCVGMGMVSFGLMQAPSVGFNYIIEAYPHLAGDCFVSITSVRAIVSFAWTFFAGDWVTSRGAAEPFGVFTMLMGLFSLLTIPMIIWGKRTRIWTAKWIPTGAPK
ncbi:hypothetical protein ACN47E_006312 [Coniothyrium glycines]